MRLEITVPSLADMKLSQYQKFLRTTEGSEDISFIHRQMVAIFCNLSDNIVSKMTRKSFDEVVTELTKTLSSKEQQPLKRIVNHDGKEYGFIPNLDEISVGEQADIGSFIADWQKMNKALGVLYRPVTLKRKENYLIEEYRGEQTKIEKRIEILEQRSDNLINRIKLKNNRKKLAKVLEDYKTKYVLDLPLDVALGAYFFFVNLAKDLLSCTPNYILNQVKQDKKSMSLVENGVGITAFTESLKETFSTLSVLLK